MSLVATVANPLTQPAPPGWDDFVAAQRLLPVWDSRLLRAADWCAQTPSSMVLVQEASSAAPVAAFHARHLGAVRLGRFASPVRVPPVCVTECRIAPLMDTGMAFADGLDDRDRAEAVRVFERGLRQRVGPAGRGIAYRQVTTRQLAAVQGAGRLRLRLGSSMVLDNQWPDLGSYLASLPGKLRGRMRSIQARIDADETLQVELAATIEPAEACWLAEAVRRRHLPRGFPRATWPAGYFERLNRLPGSRFVTYRDTTGRLLAYVTMYDNGDELIAGIWGNRNDTDGGRRNLYFDLYLRQIEWMVGSGRKRLVLGAGMVDVKARLGARAEPRWGLVGFR